MNMLLHQDIEVLGSAIADRLFDRLGSGLAPHYLPCLLRDADWLDRALTEVEAAQFVGLEVSTLQSYRTNGRGPGFVKLSARAIRFRRRDLIAWMDGNLVSEREVRPLPQA